MYTSISTDLALNVLRKKWNIIKNYTDLPAEYFLEAAELCLTSTYFKYENSFYKQKFGLPMGGPLSATAANLVLEDLEDTCLKKCEFPVIGYKRYVDDVFAIVPKNKVITMQDTFNDYHPQIKFTVELEKNCELNYLDLKLIRREGKITTQWYEKPTNSGRYLNYKSSAPIKFQRNVVSNLARRVINFTNPEDRPRFIKKLKQDLQNNNYPLEFIEKLIKKETYKKYNPGPTQTNKKPFLQDKEIVISIPYIKGVTETLQRNLNTHNIKIVSATGNCLKKFYSNVKAPIEREKTTNTVYKIKCKDCDVTYIGQSKQYLHNRITAHINSVSGKNAEKTALKKHTNSTNHQFNFKEVDILDKENNEKKRLVLEMIRIKQDKKCINDRRDTDKLGTLYDDILIGKS